MALELRPKKPVRGKVQSWVARFQVPTGDRNKKGAPQYFNWTRVIGHRGDMTKAQAEKVHDYWKNKIKSGPLIVSPTLIDFAGDYIKHKRDVESKRSWSRDVYSIRHLIKYFGQDKKLSEITPKEVDLYKASRIKSVKLATVNRELDCLRHMFNQARVWGQFEGDNPVTVSGKLRVVRDEPQPLSYEEEYLLMEVLNPSVGRISEFALNTGMRISEILNLKKSSVDFKRSIVKLEASEQKGMRVREVPLNETALRLIYEATHEGERLKSEADLIFLNLAGQPYSGRDAVYHQIVRASKRAGLKRNVHPHLFRHTFITRSIESGKVNPIAVREVVGHADLKILLRYVHLTDSKFDVVNAVDRKKKEKKSVA